MASQKSIVFLGTGSFSGTILRTLIQAGYNIVATISQPSSLSKKGEPILTEVKKISDEFNIPCFQPVRLNKEYDFLLDIHPSLLLTAAYGQLISSKVLACSYDFPPLNVHGSLLPKLRGAAPIQYSLMNGDKITGITLMEMVKGMDAGRMFAKCEVVIDDSDNATSLFNKMAMAGSQLLLEKLDLYLENKLEGEVQDETLVTVAPSIKNEEEKLDLTLSAREIHNKIRALSLIPGAHLYLNEELLKIYESRIFEEDSKGEAGIIIEANKKHLLIQCGIGSLELITLQKAGKKILNYKDFINGDKDLCNKKLA